MASATRWNNAAGTQQLEIDAAPTREAFTDKVDQRLRIIGRRFDDWRAGLQLRLSAYRAN